MQFFSDGGIRHIYLDEVTIKASKRRSNRSGGFFSGINDRGINSSQFAQMRGKNLNTILSTIPGVMVSGGRIFLRNSQSLIAINGLKREGFNVFESLEVDNIESIRVHVGAEAAFFGAGSNNGVINFITKRGVVIYADRPLRMATIRPLGCQKPEEFYVPKYEVQTIRDNPNPDLRTTIYWNPYLSSDSLGMVNVEFYTADPANDYSVVLEGMTKEGGICRYEGTVKRK